MERSKNRNCEAADTTYDQERRRFLTQILALTGGGAAAPALAGGLLLTPAPAEAQAPINGDSYGSLIVQTTAGAVRGASRKGVVCFKGIPYAGSPAGENRFKAPPPLKPWSGVRDALVYGPASIQPLDPNRPKSIPIFPTSEDCLVLNVWTPSFWAGQKRPVMFYSHSLTPASECQPGPAGIARPDFNRRAHRSDGRANASRFASAQMLPGENRR